jgi:hypothetical protein
MIVWAKSLRTHLSRHPSNLAQLCTGLLALGDTNKDVRIVIVLQVCGHTASSFRHHRSPHCMAECFRKVTKEWTHMLEITPTRIGSSEKLAKFFFR